MKTKIYYLLLLFLGITTFVYGQNLRISGGLRYSVSLCDDGSVYSWGDNSYGQLGIGTTGDIKSSPTKVLFPDAIGKTTGTKPTITAIDGGAGFHALALDCNGNVWAWGNNCEGQIGNGTGGRTLTQVQAAPGGCTSSPQVVNVPTMVLRGAQSASTGAGATYLHDIVYISAGQRASYAVDIDGNVWAWGSNVTIYSGGGGTVTEAIGGLLGNNSTTMAFSNTPVQVVSAETGISLPPIVQVDAGDNIVYLLDVNGQVWACGNNQNGQLGNGMGWGNAATDYQYGAKRVKKGAYVNASSSGTNTPLDNIVQITAGATRGMFLDVDGNVWNVGAAYSGIGGFTGGGGADAVYAAKVNSGNSTSTTGDATYLTGVDPFIAPEGAIAATQTGSGAVVSKKKSDGTTQGYLYTWGLNYTYAQGTEVSNIGGQLGQGDCSNMSSVNTPTLVTTFMNGDTSVSYTNINVIGVSDGGGVIYVITQNPTTLAKSIYVMGANNDGQLGFGNTTNACRPTLLTMPCAFPDPCPQVSADSDTVSFCGVLKDTLVSPGISKSYSYKWTYFFNPSATTGGIVTTKTAGTEGANANRFIFSTVSATGVGTGKYVVEISKASTTCGTCPVATKVFYVLRYPPSFNVPSSPSSTYCGDTAFVGVITNSNAGKNPIYSYFTSTTGGMPIGTSIGSARSRVGVPNTVTNKGSGNITLYAQETSHSSGTVLTKAQVIDPTFAGSDMLSPNSSFTPNYQSGFITSKNITLSEVKIIIKSTLYISNSTIGGRLNFVVNGAKLFNGGLVADNASILGTFYQDFSITRTASDPQNIVQQLSVPINIQLPANTNFFISPAQTVWTNAIGAGTGSIQLMRGSIGNQPVPEGDDIDGNTVQFVSSSQAYLNNQTGANLNQGYFFDLKFTTPQNYCDRVPVNVVPSCPCNKPSSVTIISTNPTATGSPKKITICTDANPYPTFTGSYTKGTMVGTNNYFYSWFKKGTTPVYTNSGSTASGSATLGIPTLSTVSDSGMYYLRVEDYFGFPNPVCYLQDSIHLVINKCTVTGYLGESSKNESQILYSPNPFKDQLIIEGKGADKVVVLNASGVLIEEHNWSNGDKLVLGQNWPVGLYLIQVFGNGNSTTNKVIKE